ncbi:MAG: 3'(2'),5'-bisphosphate nucleotidase CysQ [Hoeflea sp.]|uniref:3'(2'),5'-bisphosphate nucleotidase CysQ n=1 Tax=Hoeflea sp. TaxID=1940281 RepID=UPI003297BCE3
MSTRGIANIDGDQDSEMIRTLETAAIAAGKAILAVRAEGAEVVVKSDSSPVTQADRRAEELILDVLASKFPGIPVVAEELAEAGKCPSCAQGEFFLVDALDGTKDFIAGRADFTVNIAFVRDQYPAAGVVYAPAHGRLWCGYNGTAYVAEVSADGEITGRRQISTRPFPKVPVALVSVSHRDLATEDWLKRFSEYETENVGSSLKFCLLAEGRADVYPRLVCLKQWDIGAGDAVLRAAGGATLSLEGVPLSYGVEGSDFGCSKFVGWGQAPNAAAAG